VTTIALLGLGTMGLGMARNILRAGLDLRVWNRTRDKAAGLTEHGGYVAADPADAVLGADLIVTMLFDADSVAGAIGPLTSGVSGDAIWVQMSTVGVDGCDRLAGLAEGLGLTFVDAPVLGSKKAADDGALTILASGPDRVQDRCAPLFDAVGGRTLWVGEAGAGSRLKLVANAWVLSVLEGIAESVTLAQALGLDPRLFLQAIDGGAMDAPYVKLKGTAMIENQYDVAFSVDGAAKDAGLILAAARAAGIRMDFAKVAGERLEEASAGGHGDLDMAAIFLADRRS
jgi:3-hydroxyisobutyrate dehydrogenase